METGLKLSNYPARSSRTVRIYTCANPPSTNSSVPVSNSKNQKR
jgi:hypothetical protein